MVNYGDKSIYHKSDKDITREVNYKPVYLINMDINILNKLLLANQIEQHIKIIIHHDQGDYPKNAKLI